ncbi:MAG: plasma-membrane proton-efflux P-type ATPase [Chloroflexi bacterium]|nr:plasma-membrane proton-efflux P-type ATPase [Chloroflexota bacterium]
MSENFVHQEGLTSEEAARRLAQYGSNAIPEARPHTWLTFLRRLWGPVPWMLEVAVILELFLYKYDEAAIIASLILFNAVFSTVQEKRSSDALSMLRQHLKLTTRVRRDGAWQIMPSEQLVPGDLIHIRMGDLLPADVELLEGDLLLDTSALTGESLPVEVAPGGNGYAGAIVKHGEASARVTATGLQTHFGRTAELVRQAKSQSNLETVIFSVTKSLVILDGLLALAVVGYSLSTPISLLQILPFALILLVASVPVALPATFAIATALGAQQLSHKGVLVTNLSAIEEAAGMDVLCSDKTGTITENRLSVAKLSSYVYQDENDLLRLGAMACDPSTQDPLDLAILQRAQECGVSPDFDLRRQFLPFEPATKRSEAYFQQEGTLLHVVKGAPHAIVPLCANAPETLDGDVDHLAAQGYRVLAVAHGDGQKLQLAGLVSLQDLPRPESASLIRQIHELGIRVIMVTGDGLPTAQAVARLVGIGDHSCTAQSMPADSLPDPTCDVFAEVLPEHKFKLVQVIQKEGHIVGMTGDGVNDAPALKQAQVGIAVSNATDVAKAAASLVLTSPGLENILSAIRVSRQIYQRMLTYTLNKIIKTIQIGAFLSLGLLLTGTFVITPLLVVLLLFANDFVTMSIATDQVRASRNPDRWDVRSMLIPALGLALPLLALTFGIFLAGRNLLHLNIGQLQTLSFTTLVFTGQGMIYLVRERHHFWASRSGKWMMLASALDVFVITLLASIGILMQAIPLWLVLTNLVLVAAALSGLDFLKVWLFQKFNLR